MIGAEFPAVAKIYRLISRSILCKAARQKQSHSHVRLRCYFAAIIRNCVSCNCDGRLQFNVVPLEDYGQYFIAFEHPTLTPCLVASRAPRVGIKTYIIGTIGRGVCVVATKDHFFNM